MKIHLPHNKAALMAAFVFLTAVLTFPVNAEAANNNIKVENKQNASYSFTNPDFAFPETVEKAADKRLEKAIANKDGVAALQAAIQIVVSRNLISASSFQNNVNLLDSVGNLLPSPFNSLFTLLRAGMYAQLYNTERWKFNNRTLPLDSYSEDVMAWSGDLFARKVLQLVDEATSGMESADDMPLTMLSPVLTKNTESDYNGLSVADFIASDCIDILRNFASFSSTNVIPFRKDFEKDLLSPGELCVKRAEQLIDSRIVAADKSGNYHELAFFIYKKSQDIYGEEKVSFLSVWKESLLDTPEGGMILSLYFDAVFNDAYVGSQGSKLLYSQMMEWLGQYPDSGYAKTVKYDLSKLTRKSASADMPEYLYTDKPGKGKMTVSNVNKMYALIYRVPDSMLKDGSFSAKSFPGGAECVAVMPLTFEDTTPFSSKKEFEIPALAAGNYLIVPSQTDKLDANWRNYVETWSMQIFKVTNLTIISTNDSRVENSGIAYVVDAMTQSPVPGVEVSCIDNKKTILKSGVTDESGGFALPEGSFNIVAKKDGNVATLRSRNAFHKYTETKEDRANIFTDLSIYRPGDSVRFTVVAWSLLEEKSTLKKDTPLRVVLFDANFNEKDSLSLTTDEWGRCDGVFKLSADGLLGTYQLGVEYNENPRKRVCYRSFEVEDYKTPSFYVELQKDSTSTYEAGQLIKFKGAVKTYSGMPLAGVDVKYNVRWSPWWRFRSASGSASYGSSLLTDENGEFLIELPTANLKGTQYEYGIYTLTASATSQAGETQVVPDFRFALGNDVTLRPQISDKICVEGDSIRLSVPAYDMLDLPVIKDVEYRIANVANPAKVISGVFKSPILSLDSSLFPSGEYYMEFNTVGDTINSYVKTVVYRNDDVKCPVARSLWVPESEIVSKAGEQTVSVRVGNGYPGSDILCIVSDKDSILIREWLRSDGDMIDVKVKAPHDNQKIWLTFSGMHNFKQELAVVSVVPESSLRKMEIKTSVFRNKVSAGDKEEWKFQFMVNDDIQKGIPAFAVMSDKALNALAPFTWRFNNMITSRGSSLNVSFNNPGRFKTVANFNALPHYSGISVLSPDWNTYNYGLVETTARVMMTSRKLMGVSNASVSRSADGAVEEVAYESVAPMMYKAEAETAVTDLAESVELRPVEMPLAFFMPRLNANDKGEVTVAFDVPNFNTTWQFQLMGYNDELKTAGMLLDVVASKPVMVRSNPPRFVRTGDDMSVVATLFNNTDAEADLTGRIELFNPVDGKILLSKDFRMSKVKPSGNATMSVSFPVPDNILVIGIRSYALTDRFSDGEQTIIPVLPSSTPVVESTQFYLKSGESQFSVKLPKFDKNANVTLKYCDNPIWECLLALPSISKADSKNVFSVTRALFANAMSQNVVERYPAVKENLAKVFTSGDSIQFTSNLQKDTDLKTVALQNTPWVNDANAETERMRSLDHLLDKESADASVESLLKDLAALQTSDGGWSWCPDMKASYFITRSVLLRLGMMRQAGCLPTDALEMADKAISYCDNRAYEDYLKSDKKFSVYDMLNYLYARSFFDNGDGKSGFGSLKKKALREISDDWKNFSVYGKSIAAILMSRSKGYEKEARTVLESLNQYASKDEAKGWWLDNLSSGFDGMPKLLTTATALQAYNEIDPSAEAVEGLRQWLVLQKETENWGANSYTVEVISAIMGSGVDWAMAPEPAGLSIDGRIIDIDSREMPTGLVTVNLDASKVSGKRLSVEKHSSGPAWGGVISQYVAPIKEVKAESSPNLKIEKKLLVVSDTSSGEVANESEIHVGDKVRVTLTLTCDKDMDYVALIDERGAFLEPADQVSGYDAVDGLSVYKEVRDTKTSYFIGFLPKGVNVISYDCYADRAGEYSLGIASVQSQYSPLQTAHSAGQTVLVRDNISAGK